jgi:hypothetical protein
MFTGGRPRVIEQRLLGKQDEGAIGVFAITYCLFGLHDLFEAGTNVHCSRSQAFLRFPWNRFIERPIDFEDARSMPVFFKLPPIAGWKSVPSYRQKFPRRDIEEDRPCRWDIAKRSHTLSGENTTTRHLEIPG